jgi:hypothetical protein
MAWSGTVDNGNCLESMIGVDGVAFGLCGGRPRLGGKFATEARQAALNEMAANTPHLKATLNSAVSALQARVPLWQVKPNSA